MDVIFENYSVGGTKSEWGAVRADEVGKFMPDIALLSFGTNDGGTGTDNGIKPVSVDNFLENILAAIAKIRKYNPSREFIFVSSLMPNPVSGAFGIQKEYVREIKRVAENNDSIVNVDMYVLHEYLIRYCKKII